MKNRIATSADAGPDTLPFVVANHSAANHPAASHSAENHSAAAKANHESESKPARNEKEESDSPFAISVIDVYEGPLDLLLDLIRKQNIDIYDIPIARITEQYLAYVEKIRELDVNVAAHFIYMAAVSIHIKSKMLCRAIRRRRPRSWKIREPNW